MVKRKLASIDDLSPDPGNPRKISADAAAGLGYSIEEFGDLSGLVWNQRTGELVCGHQRLTQLRKKGATFKGGAVLLDGERFPVRVVDWTRKKQRAANVEANNPHIGGEFEGLELVLPEIKLDLGDTAFAELQLGKLGDFQSIDLDAPPADPKEDEYAEAIEFKNRGIKNEAGYHQTVLFPSDNQWGIPELRADMLSETVPTDVWSYKHGPVTDTGKTVFIFKDLGSSKLPDVAGEVLAFYCDDKRFEKVWLDAVKQTHKLKEQGWGAVITPDFSLWRGLPLIVNLWNIYKSMWCGRYWQELGIPVIPSLNWSDETTYEIAFAGIPRKAPVVSCQCQTTRGKRGKYYFIKGLSAAILAVEPQSVVIYGGDKHVKWIAPGLHDACKQTGCRLHYLRSRLRGVIPREGKGK